MLPLTLTRHTTSFLKNINCNSPNIYIYTVIIILSQIRLDAVLFDCQKTVLASFENLWILFSDFQSKLVCA
jgi:hypothetical protein